MSITHTVTGALARDACPSMRSATAFAEASKIHDWHTFLIVHKGLPRQQQSECLAGDDTGHTIALRGGRANLAVGVVSPTTRLGCFYRWMVARSFDFATALRDRTASVRAVARRR